MKEEREKIDGRGGGRGKRFENDAAYFFD